MEPYFEIRDNPTRLTPEHGIWEIYTEDGTDFFIVPAKDNFYEGCLIDALANTLSLSEAQVLNAERNAAPIPDIVRDYVDGIGNLSKAVVVACDGSFCDKSYTWGTGLLFLKSGSCLAKGGPFRSSETFRISSNFNWQHVRSSSIELLALHSGLQTSTEIGISWRRNFPASQQKEWVSLAHHLILIVDAMKPLQKLLSLGADGYFEKDAFDSLEGSLSNDIDECICHAIAAEISRAVAVFQRVTIMHRDSLPGLYWKRTGMASWQGRHWIPDRLVEAARLWRRDIVRFQDTQPRHAAFKVRYESRSRSSNELQSVTFSFPW